MIAGTLEKTAEKILRARNGRGSDRGPKIAVNAPPAAVPDGAATKGQAKAAAPTVAKLLDETKSRLIEPSVGELVRHPANRVPTPFEVARMAQTLEADGQLELLVVRTDPANPDLYQIISGETRWRGAMANDWPTLRARLLLDCDDARALELLALFNAKRTDLNPIDKARMIRELCKPIADGGSGYTREKAAAVYGLDSGAAASNLLRLLELPERWQERVATGELPQTFARFLTPYAASPAIMREIDVAWSRDTGPKAHEWDREQWERRDAFERSVAQIVRKITRPVDDVTPFRYTYAELGGNFPEGKDPPRLFDLTPELRKKLAPFTVTIDGKALELTTNVKAFDRLQLPLVKKKLAKLSARQAGLATKRDEQKAGKPKEQTPAEKAAAEKERRLQLAARVKAWRHAWLRRLCADRLDGDVAHRFACALFAANDHNVSNRLAELFRKELARVGDVKLDRYSHSVGKSFQALDKLPKGPTWRDTIPIVDALAALLRLDDRDPRRPLLEVELVDGLAAELGVDLAEAWRLDLAAGAAALASFLELHTAAQLVELNNVEGWGFYIDGKPRAAAIAIMKGRVKALKLPKSVAPVAAPAGKRKVGKQKGRK